MVRPCRQREVRVARPPTTAQHRLEIARPKQSLRSWEPEAGGRHLSGAKAVATFRATSLEHGATADGAHACAKAVRAFTFQHARLVSAFHLSASLRVTRQCGSGCLGGGNLLPLIHCCQ